MQCLLIARDPDRALHWHRRLEGLALGLPVDLGVAAASGLHPSVSAIVDAELSCIDQVQMLINCMRETPGPGTRRIFALDPGALRDHLQADILGATAKIHRDARRSEIVAALDGHPIPFPPPHTAGSQRLREGLAIGLGLVDHMQSGRRLDRRFIDAAADDVASVVEEEGLEPWIDAVQRHHDRTSRHCLVVSGLAMAFAAHLGFRHTDRNLIAVAAALHDVGKARVPVDLLDKNGLLTDEERRVVRGHPLIGHAMLLEAGGHDRHVLAAVLHHHERIDGSGYPFGLRGRDIGDVTRIVSIVDVFAALIEDRPYRKALPAAEAYSFVEREPGLDADLLRAFQPVALASSGGGQPLSVHPRSAA